MKKISNYILILGVLFGLNSCSNYLDVNDSPNDPSAEVITPDLVLAGAMTRTHSNQALTMNRLGNVFMNNWSANVNSFTGGFNEEYQLILTTNFYSGIWDNSYIRVANFQSIIDSDAANFEYHKGIAKIMKVFYMQYVVDLYGDAPYTEAWDVENLRPSYDSDINIYRNFITELNEALALLNTPSANAVGSEDVIFGGNLNQWRRMANTVKLRVLMREATRAESNADSASYLAAQFADLENDFITSDVTINPGYSNNEGAQNPFYGSMYDTAGNFTSNYNFLRASLYAQEFLDGTLTGVYDPRISEIYEPIGGSVVGVDQGIDSGDPAIPDDISAIGSGLIRNSSQDGIILTGAESYFLQSEAVFRGYLTGDAKALFQSGIQSSFDYFGLDASSYITSSNGLNEVGWDGSSNKIEAIMTQKWIATNGINAIESWIDYVRTGYPDVPLAQSAQQPTKPNRLLYPASELIGNGGNVPSQTSQSAFNTNIFWDVN